MLTGIELARAYYTEAVRPLLGGIPHAAARIGSGSDVLGFDTERSTDHDWGPRVDLFLGPAHAGRRDEILSTLAHHLPATFRGWSTHFGYAPDGVRWMEPAGDGPVDHLVRIATVGDWFHDHLGFDPRGPITRLDWLATPWQRFAEATAGAVFHDDAGDLTEARRRLDWYPDDVWRHVIACQWTRIAQEEAFVGRAAEAGDDTGSRVEAARLARDVMRLALLLARRWPLYPKWLGASCARHAPAVTAALRRAVSTDDAGERQDALCDAYEMVLEWQNRLGLTAPVDATRRPYFSRPFPVIDAGRAAEALGGGRLGSIDQLVDCTDALSSPSLCRAVTASAHPQRPNTHADG